jgi:hypothetical protein
LSKTISTHNCALCERQVGRVSQHHLIPKSEGGKYTVGLCSPCHSTLHKFFTNHTLAKGLHTIEALRAEPDIQRYLNWVKKQPDRLIRVDKRRDRY